MRIRRDEGLEAVAPRAVASARVEARRRRLGLGQGSGDGFVVGRAVWAGRGIAAGVASHVLAALVLSPPSFVRVEKIGRAHDHTVLAF